MNTRKSIFAAPAANDASVTSAAHEQLFELALKAITEVERVVHKHVGNIVQWLQVQYGDTPPTYEQFWDDRDALKQMAKARGLADDQTIRRPYNAAVRQLYGEQILKLTEGRSVLPVSTSKEAVAKRLVRPTPAPRQPATPKPENVDSAVRALMKKFGLTAIMLAFSKIMLEHKAMREEGKRIALLVAQKPLATGRRHAVH